MADWLEDRLRSHGERVALVTGSGVTTYAELLAEARAVASGIRGAVGPLPFAARRDVRTVATFLGAWRAGRVAVPYAPEAPEDEVAHIRQSCGRGEVERGDAVMLFTSGTTGRPKGVVLGHEALEFQVRCLTEAWELGPGDRVPLFLPLHHVHGLVNVTLCALWNGGTVELLERFDAEAVWRLIDDGRATVLMAVPTLYHRLVAAWDAATPRERQRRSDAARRLRLAVSGSAALPEVLFERWAEIADAPPLERYGMTEVGMLLSNPLNGRRIAGSVGRPLPGVEVRFADEEGELEVRTLGRFRGYHGAPEATREVLRDGWFRTGDVAEREGDRFRLLGRRSLDIIKTGGFKVSALEVERVLLEDGSVSECAVVGVPDPEWGERVVAVVVPARDGAPSLGGLRDRARIKLARHKLPTRLEIVSELPRNALGKVTKGILKTRLRARKRG